jgi:hypothetical protein
VAPAPIPTSSRQRPNPTKIAITVYVGSELTGRRQSCLRSTRNAKCRATASVAEPRRTGDAPALQAHHVTQPILPATFASSGGIPQTCSRFAACHAVALRRRVRSAVRVTFIQCVAHRATATTAACMFDMKAVSP